MIALENHDHGQHTSPHILSQLNQPEQFLPVADLFAQLSDPTRLRIFWLLCHRESCGVHIAETLGISTQAAAHHLRLLREKGLICCHRAGKEVHYRSCDTPGCQLLHQMMEQAMDITCPVTLAPEQKELPQRIHDYLMENLDKHIPIEELSRRFLVNPTTIKAAFKAAYGTSLAAHTRHHRMERAAQLLAQGKLSVAQVAQAVGYESGSKFASAFKAHFGTVPSKYTDQAPKQPCSCT